jgi:hypothetical protein
MDVSCQLHVPAALPSWQRTLVLIKQQAVWAPGSIDMVPEKKNVFFPLPEFKLRPVMPLGRLCTDWAIAVRINPSRVTDECILWLWLLVANFSAWRRCFSPRPDRVGFLVDKGPLWHVSVHVVLSFSRPYPSTSTPYLFIYHKRCIL